MFFSPGNHISLHSDGSDHLYSHCWLGLQSLLTSVQVQNRSFPNTEEKQQKIPNIKMHLLFPPRRPRGMYFCRKDRGEMASMVYNWESDQVGGGGDDENENGDCGDLQHNLQLGE